MGFFHKLNEFLSGSPMPKKDNYKSIEILNKIYLAKDITRDRLSELSCNKKSVLFKCKNECNDVHTITSQYYKDIDNNQKAREAKLKLETLEYFSGKYPRTTFLFSEDLSDIAEEYDLRLGSQYYHRHPVPQYVIDIHINTHIENKDATYVVISIPDFSTGYTSFHGSIADLEEQIKKAGYLSFNSKHPEKNRRLKSPAREGCLYLWNDKLSILLQPVTHNKINAYLILASWER